MVTKHDQTTGYLVIRLVLCGPAGMNHHGTSLGRRSQEHMRQFGSRCHLRGTHVALQQHFRRSKPMHAVNIHISYITAHTIYDDMRVEYI